MSAPRRVMRAGPSGARLVDGYDDTGCMHARARRPLSVAREATRCAGGVGVTSTIRRCARVPLGWGEMEMEVAHGWQMGMGVPYSGMEDVLWLVAWS